MDYKLSGIHTAVIIPLGLHCMAELMHTAVGGIITNIQGDGDLQKFFWGEMYLAIHPW